jgi:hypothetical protein
MVMNAKADKPRIFAGKWLILISLLMGAVSILSEQTAVSSFLAMIMAALLTIVCLVGAILALSRHDLALLRGRALAIAILLFPPVAFVVNGHFHLSDRIRVHFMQDCSVGGTPVGAGHEASVCLKRDREGWGSIEAIIYDNSDEIALPQGQQSRTWSLAVSRFHLPFELLPFRATSLGDHFYLVQFNEN